MAMTAFFVLLLLCASHCYGLSKSDYSSTKWFKGDGTYYGGGIGNLNGGNCAYRAPHPRYFFDYVPVAMNDKQYWGMCGACLEVIGSGKGLGANPIKGRFKAIVTDRCPECKHGDLDLAKTGDGRWHLKWRVIPCVVKGGITFQFEGSNDFYQKLQPRGLKSPARKVVVDGVNAKFSQDNHWIAGGKKFKKPMKIEVTTVLGDRIVAWVDSHFGVVKPSKVIGGKPSSDNGDDKDEKEKEEKAKKEAARKKAEKERKEAARKEAEKKKGKDSPKKEAGKKKKEASKKKDNGAAKKKAGKGKCVPLWRHCRGPKNRWGTRRCCNGGWCVRRNTIGWKCVTPSFWRKRCVPKYQVCKGWKNKWGTGKCCGGFSCLKRGRHWKCVRPKPKRCRRKYAKCGHWWFWQKKNGQRMGGDHCCQRGSRCKKVRNNHFACIPW